ncbi:MAG: hypothetical protein WEA82_00045 [Idiomarina sp.]
MKKFLAATFIIFVLGKLAQGLYSDRIDYLTLTDEQALIDWVLRAIRDIGFFLFVGVSIIWSIWSYKDSPNKRKAKWYILFTVSLGLAFSVITGYVYWRFSEISEIVMPKTSDTLYTTEAFSEAFRNYLDSPDYSVKEKSKNSHEIASSVYMETGTQIEVMDAEGNTVSYEPTADDTRFRQYEERVKVLTQHNLQSLKMAWLSTSMLFLVSLLIGCIAIGVRNFCNKQRHQTLR